MTARHPLVVTLTMNPALDKSTVVEHIFPEQKLRCAAPRLDAGGGGINVSKGLHKLGGSSLAVFPSGGINGTILQSLVARDGIDMRTIPIAGEIRESFVVSERATNAQYRFNMPGPTLSPAEVQACLDTVAQLRPDYIVASGSLPPGVDSDFFARLAHLAKNQHARFILDTSGVPLQAAANEGVFLLKPNLAELSNLAGVSELTTNQVDDAALAVIRKGNCEVIVVSMGPSGALLVTKDHYEHIPAPVVPKKSTVGAGDSMVAGMTWSLQQGKSYSEMVRMGVACGTAATMNPGTELFRTADVWKLRQWIDNYGDRYVLNFD